MLQKDDDDDDDDDNNNNDNNDNNSITTPFYFETLSLPRSPRTIQMPSHSSF